MSSPPPWRNTSTLALVRDYFYPQHVPVDPYSPPPIDKRQRGIDKVDLWHFKSPHIPHAVLATVALTEAVLHDELRERQRSDHKDVEARKEISETAVTSVYALAWVRLVNGFVDRDVSRKVLFEEFGLGEIDDVEDENERTDAGTTVKVKGGGESSMYANAVAVGMPETFVDLRHRVSHGDLPRLDVLRKMTKKGLDWLWERWWRKVATGDSGWAQRKEEEKERVAAKAREIWGDVVEDHRGGGLRVERDGDNGMREERGNMIEESEKENGSDSVATKKRKRA